MKRKRFEGIDKKIIDLLKVHNTLSSVELANYLGISRSFASTVCKQLIAEKRLISEVVRTGNHPKYFPQTLIYAINKDYKPKSYAVSMDDYIKKDNEYLTKESALLLFKQLIEVIEDQAKEIDIFKNEVTDLFKSFESVMNTHKDALDVHDQYLAMIIHTTDILGSAMALIAYQHGKPQPSLIERVMTFKEHIQTLNDAYPINCDKH